MSDETPLAGGNSTDVVRVGDTVRRAAGEWTPAVHRLLHLLRSAGVTEVPEPHGLDDSGREILSYLPGEVGNYPMPAWIWSRSILDETARLLRRFHDASVPLVDAPESWRSPRRAPAEVICHNDFAPYNLVFADGHVTGIIDLDMASPGPRLWDLAYLAYRLVPIGEHADDHSPDDRNRRERIIAILAAYDSPATPVELLEMVARRLDDLAIFTDERAHTTGRADFLDHSALYRRDSAAAREYARSW